MDALRIPQWKCLEYTKGVFETGYFGDDTVEIKFPRPIPIKVNFSIHFSLIKLINYILLIFILL